MSDLTAEDFEKEITMMGDPGSWPLWPVLPLKRPRSFVPDCGFMIATKGCETLVFYGDLHELKEGPLTPQLEGFHRKNYTDHAAILDDEWRVD